MGLGAALRIVCVGLIIWIVGAAPAWCATRHVVLTSGRNCPSSRCSTIRAIRSRPLTRRRPSARGA